MDRSRIGIVIPAFNEAMTIHSIVSSVSQYGMPIVVDDGSEDETEKRAIIAGATVVRHGINCGYDQALNSGFIQADKMGCQYVITMDADGQHDPTMVSGFIQALDDGADVVIGIRDRRQRLAESIFAWVAFAKWRIQDPLCGMKAYKISIYRELGHFDVYNSIGTELAFYAAREGKRITQIPVKIGQRKDLPRFGKRIAANKLIFQAMRRSF